MEPFGYNPVQKTSGLWVHITMSTIFSLVVNDFCVQCSSMEDANHFINSLRAKHPMIVDMEVEMHIGISLQWD